MRATLGKLQPPRRGWIRAVRTALGMTLEQLGQRLGIDRSSVLRVENSESSGRIQLDTLRRAAAALDCELHYVLVPRVPLQERVRERRAEIARARVARTAHTMGLENQHDPDDPLAAQLRRQAEAAVSDRMLWKNTR